jgi:cytochrome P450
MKARAFRKAGQEHRMTRALQDRADIPADHRLDFDYRADARMHSDPWSLLHELGAGPGFFFSPQLGGYWCAVKRGIVIDILRNWELFSCKSIRVPRVERAVASIPHHLDPPEHAKYRISVVELFGHRVLDGLTPAIRATARTLAEELAKGSECEFVRDFALRMPVEIFMRMCGLPLERRDEMVGWVQSYFHGDSAEESNSAHLKSVAYLEGWLDEQLQHSEANTGHIMPALLKTRVDGRPLTRAEMLSILITVFNGGLDTVAAQMTHIIRYLAEHAEQRIELIQHPEKIPDAVEELLRRFSIISIGREVTRDVTYEGMPLRKGDMLLCLICAAGLDESQFPGSLGVDFERSNRRQHCAFGSGPHMCVGAPLARLELRIMLEELLPRLPSLAVKPGSTLRYHTGVTLGLKELPLQWDSTPEHTERVAHA